MVSCEMSPSSGEKLDTVESSSNFGVVRSLQTASATHIGALTAAESVLEYSHIRLVIIGASGIFFYQLLLLLNTDCRANNWRWTFGWWICCSKKVENAQAQDRWHVRRRLKESCENYEGSTFVGMRRVIETGWTVILTQYKSLCMFWRCCNASLHLNFACI